MADRVDPRDPIARLRRLFDTGSVALTGGGSGSAVRLAYGRIDGEQAMAYCTDGRKMGGALGAAEAAEIVHAIQLAMRVGSPVVGIWHSGGARLADGVESMDGVGRIFAAMTRASGRVPQISIVL